MPYGRYRYGKRKRYYKKKAAAPSRWTTYTNAGSQLFKDVMMLKSLVNAEYKTFDNTNNAQSVTTTAAITNLSLTAQGSDRFNRIGNSIKGKSLYIHGYIQMHPSDFASVVRLVYFIDTQADGNIATQSEIFTANTVQSQLNIDNAGRFKILVDETIPLSGDRPIHMVSKYIKLGHHLKYAGTTALEANCRMGQIYRYIMSDEATNVPVYNSIERFRFVDN